MNVLIFGGTGYLGSKLIKNIMSMGHYITCIIRKTSNIDRICGFADKVNFLYIEDLVYNTKLEKFDCFINTAAKYFKTDIEEFEVLNSNYIVPAKIFNICLKNNIKKYITIDTGLPSDYNIYSFSKSQFSNLARWYCNRKEYGDIMFYNVKLEFFYGKDEPKDRFIPYVITRLKNNESLDLTEGNQKRDIIHIDDVIDNIARILNFNIVGYFDIPLGSGVSPSIKEIVIYLKKLLMSSSSLNFGAINRIKNEPDSIANIDEMKSFGFDIKYQWKEGLKTLI